MKNGKRKTGKRNKNRHPDTNAKLEQLIRHGRTQAGKTSKYSSPVYILVYHRRYRPIDPDNLSIKYVLDEFIARGLLRDDSAKEIIEIRHCQQQIYKPEIEETIFEIVPAALYDAEFYSDLHAVFNSDRREP